MSAKKTNQPVENIVNVTSEPTNQPVAEDQTNMQTNQQDAAINQPAEDAVGNGSVDPTANQQDANQPADNDPAAAGSKPEDKPAEDAAPIVYSAAEILAYDPTALDAALAGLRAKHDNVASIASMTKDENILSGLRATLGITADYDQDAAILRATLGGSMALFVAELAKGEQWERVAEYAAMVELINQINALRAKVGLKGLMGLRVGGGIGAASTLDGASSVRSLAGYLAVGTYTREYKGSKVVIVATPTHIKAMVNGMVVWDAAQGHKTISHIVNEHIVPACGGTGRVGAPDFFEDGGYSRDVLLATAPSVAASSAAVTTGSK